MQEIEPNTQINNLNVYLIINLLCNLVCIIFYIIAVCHSLPLPKPSDSTCPRHTRMRCSRVQCLRYNEPISPTLCYCSSHWVYRIVSRSQPHPSLLYGMDLYSSEGWGWLCETMYTTVPFIAGALYFGGKLLCYYSTCTDHDYMRQVLVYIK